MKIAKIIPITIIFLILSVTMVAATHTSTVTMTPNSWTMNTEKSVSITVANTGVDNIKQIELFVPLDSNGNPLYAVDISSITTPQGWTYSTTGTKQVTWVATGSGLASGDSLSLFGVVAKSPGVSGDFKWNWKTTDKNNGEYAGFAITTVGKAPVSYFVISGVPTTLEAGKSFKITVKAYGDDNQIKTDYVGKISFTSTDPYATLPSTYTFLSTDSGSKEFTMTYKTSGQQTFTVKDDAAGVSTTSIKTSVNYGTVTGIGITPKGKTASAGEKVEYKVTAKDAFGNVFDISDKATLTIETDAGGSWSKNVYTTAKEGTWVVIASYNSLVSGTTLTVTKGAVPPVTPPTNVTPPEEIPEMSITIPDSIKIAPGANDTMIITVNNNGDKDLTGVEVSIGGVPSEWISVYPLLNDIPAKSSKDYLVIIFVPQNESGTKTIEFKADSSEGKSATKNTDLVISSAPTGLFSLPKNILQLGVVIIAVAAVVIIGWELWFKKPKSK